MKAPKGARATYLAPPLETMQRHLNELAECLERHATVNSQARGEVKRLRETNAELAWCLEQFKRGYADEKLSRHTAKDEIWANIFRRTAAVLDRVGTVGDDNA